MIGPQILLCWAVGLYRSLACGARIAGHDLVDAGVPTPPNVQILRCERCGKRLMLWAFFPLEK